MKIDKHNYEAFILDYFEGNLSAQKQDELILFLNVNPTYRKQFEEYEPINLNVVNDAVEFIEKDSLKRTTTIKAEQFFNLTEGNLNLAEEQEVEKIIKGNSAYEKELLHWQNAKIKADLSIIYSEKEKLKRKARVIYLWQNVYLRAAAIIVFVLGAGLLYFIPTNPVTLNGLALVKNNNQLQFNKKAFEKNYIYIQPNFVNKNYIAKHFRNKIKSNPVIITPTNFPDTVIKIVNNPTIIQPETLNNAVVKNKVDSLFKKEFRGVWEAEEALPIAKKTLKHKFLDVAVNCLKGLKKIGVKKANATKETNPESGITDYVLVFGKKSYRTLQE